MSKLQPIWLAGPTAVGKSEIASHLATIISSEIISVDSMQVYRGLDIGTAKPTLAERSAIPHHLIDVSELTETFDAARFLRLAAQARKLIEQRNKAPIYCGGTGLYFKVLEAGLGNAPGTQAEIRQQLESKSLPELLRELEMRDPKMFARIDRYNRRRVVRALEVIRITGRTFSEQRADWEKAEAARLESCEVKFAFGFERDREDLRRRIDERVERMFENGLVAETERLLQNGLPSNPTAMQSIGYRQVVDYLQGEQSLEQTIALVKQRTRQFAKRQMTWFKHQLPLRWIKLGRDEDLGRVAERLGEQLAMQRPP
ncbi:MAG: tRNA (adenosine(37)-N6)-dimethylallyltransferase MiaA [Verrucomicrobia bacterium]|nr:tRNA (adenosine(37)-N6)-dimethylallyltransferase MiaA [Verrucomicrobiota bacterium]